MHNMLVPLQATDRGAAAQDFAEGSGEIDPLDAFMAENEQQIGGAEEEEIDPLDAFMADLAPTVRQDMAQTQTQNTNGPVTIKTEDGSAQPTIQARPFHQKAGRGSQAAKALLQCVSP